MRATQGIRGACVGNTGVKGAPPTGVGRASAGVSVAATDLASSLQLRPPRALSARVFPRRPGHLTCRGLSRKPPASLSPGLAGSGRPVAAGPPSERGEPCVRRLWAFAGLRRFCVATFLPDSLLCSCPLRHLSQPPASSVYFWVLSLAPIGCRPDSGRECSSSRSLRAAGGSGRRWRRGHRV